MGIGDAVKPVQEVALGELSKDFADKFAMVTWGTPGAEADDKIAVTLQLKNPLGSNLLTNERIRLTCSAGATMALEAAGNGTVLTGDGSDDMIIETDGPTGTFDLEVTFDQAGTISVVGGATQGSGLVGCKEVIDLVFA